MFYVVCSPDQDPTSIDLERHSNVGDAYREAVEGDIVYKVSYVVKAMKYKSATQSRTWA